MFPAAAVLLVGIFIAVPLIILLTPMRVWASLLSRASYMLAVLGIASAAILATHGDLYHALGMAAAVVVLGIVGNLLGRVAAAL